MWLPKKLAQCAQALADEDIVLVIHSAEVVDESLRSKGFRKPDITATETKLLPFSGGLSFTAPGFAMVFRSHLLLETKKLKRLKDPISPGSTLFAHDQWVAFLAEIVGGVTYLAEPLALYRQHGKNACGASPTSNGAMTLMRKTGHKNYRARANAARYYAKFLSQSIPAAPASWRPHLIRAIERYHYLAGIYSVRAKLHSPGQSRLKRIRAFSSLVVHSAYGQKLGRKAIVKDLVSALFPFAP